MVGFVPKEMFFTKGVGKHREKLTSFELALRSAGIAACNLVRVSSIFPPKCKILSRSQGAKRLEPGQVTFVVMSEAATREPHRLIAATVGVAVPATARSTAICPSITASVRARTSRATTPRNWRRNARHNARPGVRSRQELGREKEVYRLSNQIVRTQNVTQSAIGDKKGWWTTVVAAAVLVG